MDPEKANLLAEKRWLARAKIVRPEVRRRIAEALHIDPDCIQFLDRDLTSAVTDLFQKSVGKHPEQEFSNRLEAIQCVKEKLAGISGRAFLLHDSYTSCGPVEIDLAEVIANLEDLLSRQSECLSIIAPDGKLGALVFTQEGISAHFPRYGTIWNEGNV